MNTLLRHCYENRDIVDEAQRPNSEKSLGSGLIEERSLRQTEFQQKVSVSAVDRVHDFPIDGNGLLRDYCSYTPASDLEIGVFMPYVGSIVWLRFQETKVSKRKGPVKYLHLSLGAYREAREGTPKFEPNSIFLAIS